MPRLPPLRHTLRHDIPRTSTSLSTHVTRSPLRAFSTTSNLSSPPPPSSPPTPSSPPKQSSPHTRYYAVFARPLAKVLTLSFLTYQIVYWGWVKLEGESIKHGKDVEVKGLEDEVRRLAAEKKGKRLLEE